MAMSFGKFVSCLAVFVGVSADVSGIESLSGPQCDGEGSCREGGVLLGLVGVQKESRLVGKEQDEDGDEQQAAFGRRRRSAMICGGEVMKITIKTGSNDLKEGSNCGTNEKVEILLSTSGGDMPTWKGEYSDASILSSGLIKLGNWGNDFEQGYEDTYEVGDGDFDDNNEQASFWPTQVCFFAEGWCPEWVELQCGTLKTGKIKAGWAGGAHEAWKPKSVQGGFRGDGQYTFTDDGDGSEACMAVEWT